MCGTWTQDQWIDATNNQLPGYENDYDLLGTRYNAEGQRALQVQNRWGEHYIRNIYSEDGRDEHTYIESKREANKRMKDRGFTFKTDPTAAVLEEVEATQTGEVDFAAVELRVASELEENAIKSELLREAFKLAGIDLDINTVVEGKTLFEWSLIGHANEGTSEHVHAPRPQSMEHPTPEAVAYQLSLTMAESMLDRLSEELVSAGLGVLG